MTDPAVDAAHPSEPRQAAGLPLWLLVLTGPVWVPFWAVGSLAMFIVGVCRYLVVDRALFPLLGRKVLTEESGLAYVLTLALCVIFAPVVLAALMVWGTVKALLALICLIGYWQAGGDGRNLWMREESETKYKPLRRLLRQLPIFLAGALWLLLVTGVVASLIRPVWVYEHLTGHDPTRGVINMTGKSWYENWLAQDRLSPVPWWVLNINSPVSEAMTDFQMGFALLAVLLLVRWPGMFAGWLGRPGARWGQVALRYVAVLVAGLLSLFVGPEALLGAHGLLLRVVGELVRPLGESPFYILPDGGINCLLAGSAVALLILAVLGLLMFLGARLIQAHARLRQYVPFIAWRLLERKLIAFFAVGAICLCTAMVLVVYSIMGGFLDMMLIRSHNMLGDLVVDAQSDTGFTGYGAFLKMLREDPRVEAATPIIYTKGLLRIGRGERVIAVNVVGIDLPGKEAVVGFTHGLRFQKDAPGATFDLNKIPGVPAERMKENPPLGAILGRDTIFRRDRNGNYNTHKYPRFSEFVLSVVTLSPKGNIGEPLNLKIMFVDDHLTGVYDIDSRQVYVDFNTLQKILNMDAGKPDPETGTPGRQPRASQIQIRLKRVDGQPPDDQTIRRVRDELQSKWDTYAGENASLVTPWVDVSTWDQVNENLINAVRKEKFMVTTLFGGISLVSVLLVFTLLYLIAMDKTRDIGVIKAVGGSDAGAAAIFVAYGAVMGLVGGGLGLALGWQITIHINQIQDFLASLHPALRVWDPSVYVFESIPNHVNPTDAVVIFLIAVISSTLGAVVPAIKAARLQPVETLRYE